MSGTRLRLRLSTLLPCLILLLAPLPARGEDLAAVALELFRLVNEERARAGVPPLAAAAELNRAAEGHARWMAETGTFSHYGAGGSSPWDRMLNAGYPFLVAGENIAYGFASAAAVMAAWMNSPGHRVQMLHPEFSEIGIGVARGSGELGALFWVQDFGHRPGGPPPPPPPSSGPPPPTLAALAPSSGRAGDRLTLTGSNLDTTGTVTFAPGLTARVLAAAAERWEVEVPAGAASGDVHLQNAAGTSNGVRFELLPPAEPPPSPEAVLEALAAELLRLVNLERASAGVPPLVLAPELTRAAKAHSQSMADTGLLSHYGPDGSTPWDRIRREGYRFLTAGEIIAFGYETPAAVMTAWMNSPGHRANLLHPLFTEVGIGIARKAPDTPLCWTQDFGRR